MKKILLLATVFLMSACDSSYSASDFKKDKDLRDKLLMKCQNESNPSDTVVKNCQNLQEAIMSGLMDDMKNVFGDSKKSNNWK